MKYEEKTGRRRYWYFEAGLNYNRSFGLNNVGAILLYNQDRSYYPITYTHVPHRQVGLVGRDTYDWNNRNMAEITLGNNGSEHFATGKRYGNVPAM